MKRPNEADYTSQVAYTRALEEYCDMLEQPAQEYERGYAHAMNWKVQNHLEHLPPKAPVPCKHEVVYEDYLTAPFAFCKHCNKEWTEEMQHAARSTGEHMKDEALKLALDALDSKHILGCGEWRGQQLKAITAIKEALAQPAQPAPESEPVDTDELTILWMLINAWRDAPAPALHICGKINSYVLALKQPTPPAAQPAPVQERSGMTDEAIQKVWDVASGAIPGWSRHIAYARAIEAAHGIKEKNT
jgi:hypothetical protein